MTRQIRMPRFLSNNNGAARIAGFALATVFACSAATASDLQRLKALSLTELANLEVSIVGKRPVKLSETAAAVYVITAEDIRRSTATRLPELLRHVPGLNFARIDSGEWAISSRGFADRFANKLLVLIDGRSVYSPLFSGVFWEAQDLPLDNIERIEVIRGPGAATWGANAVNGVINIILKSAVDTQGTSVMALSGDEQRAAWGRVGGEINANTHYRLDAKITHRDALDEGETRLGRRAGFRLDHEGSANDHWGLQGGLFSDKGEDPDFHGWFLLADWRKSHDGGAGTTLNLSAERLFSRAVSDELIIGTGQGIGTEVLTNLEFELRHQLRPWNGHRFSLGLGMRRTESELDPQGIVLGIEPRDRVSYLYTAFLQDEVSLVPEHWTLTWGARFEHNDYTGLEVQPSVRLNWRLSDETDLWASVGRAVRSPTRVERDVALEIPGIPVDAGPFGTVPLALRLGQNPDFGSEDVIAYELGWRQIVGDFMNIDIAAFYNRYKNLGVYSFESPELVGLPPVAVLAVGHLVNSGRVETYGAELAVDLRLSEYWRTRWAYTYLQADTDLESPDALAAGSGSAAGSFPRNLFSLHSAFDIGERSEFDVWVYYADSLPEQGVEAYTALDLRLAHRLDRGVSLELIGRNLLDPEHYEWGDNAIGGQAHPVGREFFVKLRLDY